MTNKTIYLLIGPKGSGKSFIGTLMDQKFGIPFIRVEDWAKKVKKDRKIDNEDYLSDVFSAIERGIRHSLDMHDKIVFESTGLTPYFEQMFKSIKRDFSVVTIGVHANHELCLHRVKSRDQSNHINVSDEQVNEINKQVTNKEMRTDMQLINEGKSVEELVREMRDILK
ncbi:AAA family ATPase [Rossellomorea aquimaris]|nr:AAA family ATPase [Rossellomorea aquimaris]WRP07665.1 AAA family ATPase [Rossellomorea aquimaris]